MRTLAAGAAIVVCLVVSACAGTGPNGLTRGASMDDEIDYGKVIAVNDWAAKRQAKVLWLNYPKKSPPDKG